MSGAETLPDVDNFDAQVVLVATDTQVSKGLDIVANPNLSDYQAERALAATEWYVDVRYMGCDEQAREDGLVLAAINAAAKRSLDGQA
jgi:hypothetical protein